MAYRMAQLPMTLTEAEETFALWNLVIPITQGIRRVLTTVCLHIKLKAHFLVKDGLLQVSGNHVRRTVKVVISLKRC